MNLKLLILERASVLVLLASLALAGCATMKPMPVVGSVDLKRFMGDWYVIASIPTFIEASAHNAVESYRLADDGTVETTFSFNKGSFDGPLKVYKPRGFIVDKTSNAVWGMQFIWPIKAEYLITYLADDYSQTVISRSKRDYVWVMARTPTVSDEDYRRLADFVKNLGYDITLLKKVPQQISQSAP
jgi:apolipoprotein D and lipocalin family protein